MGLTLIKKIAIISVVIVVFVFGILSLSGDDNGNKVENKAIFGVTLADPKMYQDGGVFTDTFSLEEGEYFFRFVPNGDSPKLLSIALKGEDFAFNENFTLNGTLHETGISQYYTWDYDGQKEITVSKQQDTVVIEINPNGNFLGSVSVDILEN